MPADVVAERFERLKTVVDRSALARHQARVGRSEEVLVEGREPARRVDADRAHPAGEADPLPGAGRRGHPAPGALARVTVTAAIPTTSPAASRRSSARPRHRVRIPVASA